MEKIRDAWRPPSSAGRALRHRDVKDFNDIKVFREKFNTGGGEECVGVC